jgi:hypothetical protein
MWNYAYGEGYEGGYSEPDHFTITFEGEARYVRLNKVDIPEFPPIIIVPLFMTATLLALIYRRKSVS